MFSIFSNKFFITTFFLMMEKLILKQDPATADHLQKNRGFSAGCLGCRRQETSGSTEELWSCG